MNLCVYHRYNVIAINQTLEEKLGTHEAVFYQLANNAVNIG